MCIGSSKGKGMSKVTCVKKFLDMNQLVNGVPTQNNKPIPIKILKSYLIPLDITDATTKNISPPTENDYTIVWVEKCLRN